MSENANFTLEEYRIQREYRQAKRKEYLRRFQVLKHNLNGGHHSKIQHSHKRQSQQQIALQNKKSQKKAHPTANKLTMNTNTHTNINISVERQRQRVNQSEPDISEELIRQNQMLKEELSVLEEQQRAKLNDFKNQIGAVKETYVEQIKKISQTAQKNKAQTESKMLKVLQQTEAAVKKNIQIEDVNKNLKKQLTESDSMMSSYTSQIKNQYSKKLGQFEKIFNSSNQKIQQMEKQFNEDEFIENALKNQELLKSIQENASKAEDAIQILSDYQELYEGKKQILFEITKNIQMKETQLKKMNQLQGKMKIIFEKMNIEKSTYVQENNRMAKQLMQIKELLMGVMGGGPGGEE